MKGSRSSLLRLSILLCAAVLLGFQLNACTAVRGGPEPDTLRMNIGSEPPSLDWDITTDSTSFDVVSNLMVGLTQYTPDLTCAPACATTWEVLDGGKRYLFHLRKDVVWTDGKQLTARDFQYAWTRLLAPKTAAQYAYFLYDIENAFEFNTGKIKDRALVGVKALDDFTLEVKLKRPAAYFIYLTAFGPCYPQRQDVVERWKDHWTDPEHIVTNGPFMLSKWAHEYKIELIANPRFFEGETRLKKIKMFMVPEQSTAFALYENDQLDYVDNRSMSTPDVERCKNSPEYKNIPLLRNNYVGFNVTKKPFDDARVRRAFSMAIDRTVFPRILRRNEFPISNWLPPRLLGSSPDSGPKFDPQAARKLLAEAGYPDGKDFPPTQVLFPNREDTRLVMEAIQDELKRNLHVNVELVNQEWKVFLQTLHRDPPQMFRNNWGADYPDPETYMNLFTSHSGNNYTCWANAQYDHLHDLASAEQDVKTRGKLYQQMDELLSKEEVPIIPTYLGTQNLMIKPWVKGLKFNALDIQFFKAASITQEKNRTSDL